MTSLDRRNEAAAQALLRELSVSLHLAYEAQDWGIINADGERLEEFLRYLEAMPLQATQLFEMGELVLASANERLASGATATDPGIRQLLNVLGGPLGREWTTHLRYWASLPADEFPVSKLIGECGLAGSPSAGDGR